MHSDIGLESALLLAQEGVNVLLVGVNLSAEKALVHFPKAAVLKVNVGKEADVKGAINKAVELLDRLDTMVRVYLFSLLLPHLLYH